MSRLSDAARDRARLARNGGGYRSWNNFTPDERQQMEQQAKRDEQSRQWDLKQAKKTIAEEIDKTKKAFEVEEGKVKQKAQPDFNKAKSAFDTTNRTWNNAKNAAKAAERKFKEAERAWKRAKGTPTESSAKKHMDGLKGIWNSAKRAESDAKGPRDRAYTTMDNAGKTLRDAKRNAGKAKGEWNAAKRYK